MNNKELERKINVLKHTICELEREVIRLKSEKEKDQASKERSGEQTHHLNVSLSNGVAHGKYRTNINQSNNIRGEDEHK